MIAPSVPPHRLAPASSLVGTSLGGGRYAVLNELGVGGMGEVYRARDHRLNRDVAVKRIAPALRDDPAARARFLREVRRTSRLDDPHLAVVHDVLEEQDDVFLVLELVSGQTLRERALQGPLALEEFLSIAIQSARALAAAHGKGIVHCDLKPENVMVTPNGHVKVLDFGLALALPRRLGPDDPTLGPGSASAPSPADENAGAGTAPYMPPEALRGEPCDERSDLFALGVVLYEAWTGRHPFRGPNLFVTSDHILHDAAPAAMTFRPETPPALDELFRHLLTKERVDRPAGAIEVLARLRAIAHGRPGVLDPNPVPLVAPRRPLAPAWMLVPLLVLASSGAVLALNPPLRHRLARVLGIEQPLPDWRMLAVLPFSVAGGDSTARALADGLTYTITSQLTRAQPYEGRLQVVPMSEVVREKIASSQDARRRLGATLTVEGNVQRVGNGLRVNCSVVDAVKGMQLRSLTVDAPAGTSLVQDQVALGLVDLLELDLGETTRRALVPARDARIPAGANALCLEGRGYLLQYDDSVSVARALRAFEEAARKAPRFAPAWAGAGDAQLALFRLTKRPFHLRAARVALERGVALDPGLAAAHAGLGQVQVNSGFPEIAIQEYRKAIALDPTSDAAYRGLASAYEALGQAGAAEAAYREAIARHPTYWGGYSWLGVFYLNATRYPEALGMFRRVIELQPDNARGWRNLGATLNYMGRDREAIAAYEHSLRLRPDYVTYSNMGSLLLYQNRFEQAEASYRKALALNDSDFRIWGNLADCVRHRAPPAGGEARAAPLYARAIQGAETALETNPRDPVTLASLAEYHANLGHRADALLRLGQALALRPDNPEIQFFGVVVHERLGMRSEALRHLERSLSAGYSRLEFEHNPDLAALRRDPRFAVLAQRE
jgi:serine/threonine-protein kinase